ncbi:MAG: 50S ribosomal protein L17 [Candidatus Omnitrophica bacterium]|jgi:large subunit ribosomal protein L17|nr:50S ribosomal protein L17 [Candidatus Omnitrophota bacterium]MDD5079124.1 50S ribosomal protein L17 [Candidatus Omnitrophota bacterium]
MRHKKAKDNLNRITSWRKATLISMVKSLLKYQRIKTTLVRAKMVRSIADKLITMAKKNTLAQKRQANQILSDHKLVSVLFEDIGPRFAKRQSGFTRILKLGFRRGDNAELVVLEFTEIKENKKKTAKAETAAKTEHPSAPQEHAEKDRSAEQDRPKAEHKAGEKPAAGPKPAKKFLGGIRDIFKKERDSL